MKIPASQPTPWPRPDYPLAAIRYTLTRDSAGESRNEVFAGVGLIAQFEQIITGL